MISKYLIIFFSLCITTLILFTVSVYSQELVAQQRSEIAKVSGENENVDIGYELLQQGLALIGIVGGAGATAFFAWRHERRIPLPAEQEKIIRDIVKAWYNSSYLDVYKAIWNDIQYNDIQRITTSLPQLESDADIDKKIDNYWKALCINDFKMKYFSRLRLINRDKPIRDPTDDRALINYLKEKNEKSRLGLKNDKKIEAMVVDIKNETEAEYHIWVQKTLPEVAEIAVTSVLGAKSTIHEKDYDVLVEKSLNTIKRLMIFYLLAEDQIVVKTLIRSKLTEKIHKLRDSERIS